METRASWNLRGGHRQLVYFETDEPGLPAGRNYSTWLVYFETDEPGLPAGRNYSTRLVHFETDEPGLPAGRNYSTWLVQARARVKAHPNDGVQLLHGHLLGSLHCCCHLLLVLQVKPHHPAVHHKPQQHPATRCRNATLALFIMINVLTTHCRNATLALYIMINVLTTHCRNATLALFIMINV